MKRYLQITVPRSELGEEVFTRLSGVMPGDYSGTFHARFRDDSAQCREVLRILHEAGLAPHGDFEPFGPGKYSCWPNYEYEQDDLDRASSFQMLPHQSADRAHDQTSESILSLKANRLARKGPLLLTDPLAVLVSSKLRAELEAAEFIGLEFRATQAARVQSMGDSEVVPWSKVGCEPYWRVDSSVRLPRLSPRCRLVDVKGRPVTDEDSSKGVALLEGEFPAGELHYRSADIHAVEPFDAAMTREPLAYGRGPRLVVSRRVYDFINARRLKVTWLPVYVDEE
ncbi:MAG: hypothetical protein EA376_03630 [Phycisphaeraceae bacterium]|nr:MAG: hypothetical protein EA376_03630 [Phycisphaeraceae bacterium]